FFGTTIVANIVAAARLGHGPRPGGLPSEEVRGAGEVGVWHAVAIRVHLHEAGRHRRDGLAPPGEIGIRREMHFHRNLEHLAAHPADWREAYPDVERERRGEPSTVLVLSSDDHARDRLNAIEPHAGVKLPTRGLDRRQALERQG